MIDDADPRTRERVGTVINDKWTLERLLGVGGMAAVYAGRHRNGARAAVKILHVELARHPQLRERFLREGYAANRVDHPGAVKVMDDDVIASGPDAGTAYLVMELLEGESLQDRLERGPPVGESEFLTIAESVLAVLEVAHASGVVHRDLKPENLFFVKDGSSSVKVLDFGLARLLEAQAITSYGLALGTPSFMPPEQAAGHIDEIDGRADLFAMAATGFRLRTGRRIHEGANPVELVVKMANLPAPKIQTVAADVSAPFARVIDRALEYRREDRYLNATAMREDVRRAIAELAKSHPPQSAMASLGGNSCVANEPTIELSAGDLERTDARALPVLPSVPRTRRRRSLLPWLALVVVAGIATKLWIDAGNGGSSKASYAPASISPSTPMATSAPSASTSLASTSAPSASMPVQIATSAPSASEIPATGSTSAVPNHPSPARMLQRRVHSANSKHPVHTSPGSPAY